MSLFVTTICKDSSMRVVGHYVMRIALSTRPKPGAFMHSYAFLNLDFEDGHHEACRCSREITHCASSQLISTNLLHESSHDPSRASMLTYT